MRLKRDISTITRTLKPLDSLLFGFQGIIVFNMFFHQVLATSKCNNGLQYECQSVKRTNRSTCFLGCNKTITRVISPESCSNECCKVCYFNCMACTYSTTIALCIKRNSSLLDSYFDTRSDAFTDIKTYLQNQSNTEEQTLNHASIETEILSIHYCTGAKNSVKLYLKITVNRLHKLKEIIGIIRNATLAGKLGKFVLVKSVFETFDNIGYQSLLSSKKEEKIDVVELSVTCVAAFIIVLSIIWCFFYLCTTPAQRERYKCCRPCRSNRTVNAP